MYNTNLETNCEDKDTFYLLTAEKGNYMLLNFSLKKRPAHQKIITGLVSPDDETNIQTVCIKLNSKH